MAKKSRKSSFLKTKKSFTGLQVVLFAIVFSALGIITIWQTLAAPSGSKGGGKPSRGGTGTISAPVMVTDLNSNGLPNWNDTITFNISTTATTEPWVHLKCTQNGTSVYQAYDGYFDRSLTSRNFALSSNGWTSGAADCTAWLENGQGAQLASTSFHVNA